MNARSVLVVVAALMVLVARSARADDVHYYALRDGRIVVDDRQELQTPVECKQTFALVVTGRYLFVACGAEGAATYSLSEPLHPVMTGRIETPCETLTSQGVCNEPEPAPVVPAPVVRPPPVSSPVFTREAANPTMRAAGIGFVTVGGATLIGGGAVLVSQLGKSMSAALHGCGLFGGCDPQPGPASSIGMVGTLMTGIGALTALVGVPLIVSGSHKTVRAAAYASPGGGGMRVTF